MELSNTCIIPASVEATWACLNDPEFLKGCIPGCESIETVGDNDFKVVVAAKVGPVSARFTGRLRLEDLQPPTAYAVVFEGNGGAAGFAKGRAQVTLAAEGPSTTAMTYRAQAQIGGKLAQIGSRLIDGAAAKLATDFFTAFNARMTAAQAPGASAAPDTADTGAPGACALGAAVDQWLARPGMRWLVLAAFIAALLGLMSAGH